MYDNLGVRIEEAQNSVRRAYQEKEDQNLYPFLHNVSVLLICACNFLDSEYSAKTDVSSSKKEYEKGKKKYQSVLKKQETLLRGKTNKKVVCLLDG